MISFGAELGNKIKLSDYEPSDAFPPTQEKVLSEDKEKCINIPVITESAKFARIRPEILSDTRYIAYPEAKLKNGKLRTGFIIVDRYSKVDGKLMTQEKSSNNIVLRLEDGSGIQLASQFMKKIETCDDVNGLKIAGQEQSPQSLEPSGNKPAYKIPHDVTALERACTLLKGRQCTNKELGKLIRENPLREGNGQ